MMNNVMLSAASLDFTICLSFFARRGENDRQGKYMLPQAKAVFWASPILVGIVDR
jgi:hypothetical protein